MKNNAATINGLSERVSVLENNKNEQPAFQSDVLFNEKDPFNIEAEGIYYDESFTITDYCVEDFGEPINLLSTSEY